MISLRLGGGVCKIVSQVLMTAVNKDLLQQSLGSLEMIVVVHDKTESSSKSFAFLDECQDFLYF